MTKFKVFQVIDEPNSPRRQLRTRVIPANRDLPAGALYPEIIEGNGPANAIWQYRKLPPKKILSIVPKTK